MTYRERGVVGLAVLLLVVASCGDSTAQTGDTTSSPGTSTTAAPVTTTEAATTTTLSPLEIRSGLWEGATEFGTFAFTVSPDGTELTHFDLVYEEGGMTFSVRPEGEVSVPIDEDDAVNLQLGDTIFDIRFSDDGTSATGYLEFDIPMAGNFSEDWQVTR